MGRSIVARLVALLPLLALLTGSPLEAQAPQQHLEEARKLLRDVPRPADGDLAGRISTLQEDFNNFASEYLLQDSPAVPVSTAEGGATRQTDWRSRYLLVEAGLTALIGPANAPDAAGDPALEPQLRDRLRQIRTHLQMFYAATIQAREGNPVAHTGTAPSEDTPVAPTAAAPQTPPPVLPKQDAAASQDSGTPARTSDASGPGVGIDPTTALFLLERIQSILDQAVKGESTDVAPVGTSAAASGKVTIDRALFDEVRAELNQIKALLKK